MMLDWLRRWWQNEADPLPRGLVSMDVPPPVPTDMTPEEIVAPLADYDG
jgi:hypothetical protein